MTMSNNLDEEVDDHMFSDPEDFVDDISDSELLADIISQAPSPYDGQNSMVIVDGIPQVGIDRLEKLKNVLRKIFSRIGNIVTDQFPIDENNRTKGFFFIEYETPEIAQESVKLTNNYRLDKQHVFSVNLFTDLEKFEKVTENYQPPEPQPYVDHGNLRQWLQDPDCNDQYVVMHDEIALTSVYLNSGTEPTLLEERKTWTDSYVIWSPLGTYLATFHQRGIALWGGEKFKQLMKFSHCGVHLLDFSPQENYLVSYSTYTTDGKTNPTIHIWDVKTGALKRTFHVEAEAKVWPIFKWSQDDKYFARAGFDSLSIYETPSFGLLDKKSVKVHGIKGYSWSPTNNIISYWVAEDKDVPARVTLLEIPSRKELRSKNLFNVTECKMHWQKSGDYLCVNVVRYSKMKREKAEIKYSGFYYNLEIFFLREKQIPVDSIEIKETIIAFAWEPVGNKFSVIHGEGNNNNVVSFYGIKSGNTVALLKKLERKSCNHLFWSPQGQFIVLACLRSINGGLEFMDTSDFTSMGSGDHYNMTDVIWDTTGRYVISYVSYWGHKFDNAYWLWSFQGKLLRKHPIDKLSHVVWRPRPPSILTEEQKKDIKKNLKKYSTTFDVKDRMSISKASKALVDKRKKLVDAYREFYKLHEDEYDENSERRIELREDIEEYNEEDWEEEVFEFLIKEEITPIETNE